MHPQRHSTVRGRQLLPQEAECRLQIPCGGWEIAVAPCWRFPALKRSPGLMIRPSMSIPIANPDCFIVHFFEQMPTS